MATNDKTKYENFLAEMNGLNSTETTEKGFFTKNNMIGKVVFNNNGKRLHFGKIYEDPIYHGYDYDKHPNQYEIRVKAVKAYEITDKEKYKNNYTRWWLSTSTNITKDLIIVDDSDPNKVVIDKSLTKKLAILQNELKKFELEKEKNYFKFN